ncbi:type II toxin-antitoxin system HicB family antitoxin [Rhizobium sp. CC-YZS058]|uniref:type II toxin-antitoxin system HicB family antitoxin n=1 Tax=Rhizobium sp. CC-YZS058 TaxID=3042153 RepID=UPI002B059E0D|nr:type II toxin-antitoxin system HicB family antitoxin [Rhizobium sp. CC-YZS058]MEA3536506.1 type II toxin-antitoxin system HicB family antitoxin [Rhizobium sp. CC-YZS058]
MEFTYHATLKPDPDGGFLVTFADVPQAITAGETRDEALAQAREALSLALRGVLASGEALPISQARDGVPIAVEADVAAKLALVQAFRASAISKTDLARRLGKSENEARRLLDPDHPSKIGALQDALRTLGREIVVSVRDAA